MDDSAMSPGGAQGDADADYEAVRAARRAAHDLNNAIQIVSMNLFLVREEVDESGEVGELLGEMTEALERAKVLAGELGRFARDVAPALMGDHEQEDASDGPGA